MARAWASGARWAAEELHLRHAAEVRARVHGVVRRPELRQDVEQDAWEQALTWASSWSQRCPWPAWVAEIARRRAARAEVGNRVRINLFSAPTEEDLLKLLAERSGGGPGAGAAEARVLVRELLAGLPQPQRAAVLLIAGLGHDAEEAAASMGCPVDTARTRLWYARRRMAAVANEAA